MSSFVDEAQIHVKAGNGGAGSVSFRREAHVSKGGPDGGNGGTGGSVWLQADPNVVSLLAFRDFPHREATSGKHGSGKKRHGASGDDTVVLVPEGTLVKDRDGTILADLSEAGARWMAAEGGRGGRGNASFLSQKRRAPNFAEQGEYGEEFYFNLELRLMADVALVGFPNAGKSSLISHMSAAKPKIADYPFTTLEPHLGVVRGDDYEYTLADIPGLIEGASEGRGLGHKFLRHIERARALLILIDLASTERDAAKQEETLLSELGNYLPELLERPRMIVGSRSDAASALEMNADWKGMRVSSVTGEGITELAGRLSTLVEESRANTGHVVTYVVQRPVPEGVVVERDNEMFVVKGKQAERAVALNDLTNLAALSYAEDRLRRIGVYRALAKAGARSGDTVVIGKLSFTYEPD